MEHCPPKFYPWVYVGYRDSSFVRHAKETQMRSETINLSMSEAELVRLAREGHIGAFATLFELHKTSVYSLCRESISSVADAEEMIQDIFLDVFRTLAACPDGANFSEMLYRAADSRIQMHERTAHLSAPFLDHLVALAGEPVVAPRSPGRFARIRAQLRSARAAC